MSYAGVESEDDYQARRQAQSRQIAHEISPAGRGAAAQKKFDEQVSQLKGRIAHMTSTIKEFTKALPKLRKELNALKREGPMCNGCGLNPCSLYPGCNYERESAPYS